jgi:hypothetical protein
MIQGLILKNNRMLHQSYSFHIELMHSCALLSHVQDRQVEETKMQLVAKTHPSIRL